MRSDWKTKENNLNESKRRYAVTVTLPAGVSVEDGARGISIGLNTIAMFKGANVVTWRNYKKPKLGDGHLSLSKVMEISDGR